MLKHELVKEIIIDQQTIQNRIAVLADEIKNAYQDIEQPLILIGILRGCLHFLSDFMLKLDMECALDCMYIESYAGGIEAAVEPKIRMDILSDIKNRDVLIVEDIIDSGYTLSLIVKHLQKKQPRSIKILTLLDKKVRRKVNIEADWFGFEVPDAFLIGYGLDYQEILRNLPYVAIADVEKIKRMN